MVMTSWYIKEPESICTVVRTTFEIPASIQKFLGPAPRPTHKGTFLLMCTLGNSRFECTNSSKSCGISLLSSQL